MSVYIGNHLGHQMKPRKCTTHAKPSVKKIGFNIKMKNNMEHIFFSKGNIFNNFLLKIKYLSPQLPT